MDHVIEESTMSNLNSVEGNTSNNVNPVKKRRNPGNPDPDAEVIALSPKTLMAKNRFLCEICNKGFQRDQNLQLHRRGHNLPWKLKQRPKDEIIKKKVYICPEISCVHNHASRALGDLTGIKKHFSRKHGEKKYKCEKCSKKYAVQCDWKAHSKTCGTREYKCDCGTIFSRRDSFITHRAFCDALAEENAMSARANSMTNNNTQHPLLFSYKPPSLPNSNHTLGMHSQFPVFTSDQCSIENNNHHSEFSLKMEPHFNLDHDQSSPFFNTSNSLLPLPSTYQNMTVNSNPILSATALLQKAAEMGATMSSQQHNATQMAPHEISSGNSTSHHGLMNQHDMNVHVPNSPRDGSDDANKYSLFNFWV